MKFFLSLVLGVLLGLSGLPGQAQPAPESNDLRQARLYYRSARPDSAAYYARRAIAKARQRRQWNDYGWALGWLGNAYQQQARHDSAFYYLSQALVAVTSNSVPDTTRAVTYHRLGEYYYDVNRPDQAIEVFQRALRIRELLADPAALASTYKALAKVYRFVYFDYLTAERYYQQALHLLEGSAEPNNSQLFIVLYGLATTNRLKEDHNKALAYGYRAASLAQNLGSLQQEVCYTMLGNIQEDREKLPAAIRNFEQALELGIARLGRDAPSLMIRYNNLAAAYINADSVARGLRMLTYAEQLYHNSPRAEWKDDLADAYEYRGDAYVKQAKPALALDSYLRSLAINQAFFGSKHPITSRILSEIARLYQQQSRYDSAQHYLQRSLIAAVPDFHQTHPAHNPTVAMMQNNPLNFELLHRKTQLLLEQPDSSRTSLDLALRCFAQADSLIDSCRVLYDREAAKLSFLEKNKKVYEQAVACAYRLYHTTGEDTYLNWAFHFMEKSKAVVLWESLVDSQIKNSVGIPDSLLEQERAINRELAFINNQLSGAAASRKDTATRVADYRARQFALARQREALSRTFRERYPRYFRIKYGQSHYTLAQARKHTRATNTPLVEYLWGEDAVYAIGVSPRQTVLTRIPLRDSLRQALATVQQALRHPPRLHQPQADFQSYTAAAYRLYQSLLLPLLESPPTGDAFGRGLFGSIREAQHQTNAQPITIVPDGPLAYLPFEALLTRLPEPGPVDYRNLAYVVDALAVSYAPSAQVLTQRTPSEPTRRAMRFLAFGYSESTPTRTSHNALPGTGREIQALGKMAEGTYYLGSEATESHFKSEAEHYDLIHLAVHGRADTLNPNNSRLIFRNEQDSTEDGLLYSFELYDLQLRADLAVLSACESGTGKMLPGEGVYSLARGFTYAGCPTVVMSLWKVDDQQTSELMPTFYRTLYDGNRVDQALRVAKLQYRERCHPFFAHPAFWSAFVVGGVTAPVVSYQTTYRAVWIILLLATVYLAVGGYQRWHRTDKKKGANADTLV